MRGVRWALALGLAGLGLAGLAACDAAADDAANTLAGSVSRVYPLGFEHTRARLGGTELAIQYVAAGGAVPVQVVVRLADCPVDGPGPVDLTACGAVLGQRGASDLPAFRSGALRLSAYAPTPGAPVVGEFDAVVQVDTRDFAVRGTFDTALEAAP